MHYSIGTLLIVSLVATIIGFIIGAIVAWRSGPSNKAQHKLKNRIADLEQQQEIYKHKVNEHFADTATLLGQLASSYRDVHNHLAQGAQQLAEEETSERLTTLPENRPEEAAVEIGSITPPLDYAVKSTTYDTVVIDEEAPSKPHPKNK